MEDFVQQGRLFDLYGALLNENQSRVYEYHVLNDMSFSEIGEELGISRQAAQDLFHRSDAKLHKYERILGLDSKLRRIRELACEIEAQSREAQIRALAGEIRHGI